MRKLSVILGCIAVIGCSKSPMGGLPGAADGNGVALDATRRPDDAGPIFKLVHSFRILPKEDGHSPQAALLDVSGTFYGTTISGGRGDANCDGGCGTVFKVTKTGAESVVHSFTGGNGDGSYPSASLIDVDGTLYGTTRSGGTGCDTNGCGTVFAIDASGQERVVYSFKGGADGVGPVAGLIDVAGTLFGTTLYGGTGSNGCQSGCGTVFAVTTSGVETVLHSFQGGSDGVAPWAALTNVKGTLYGTTAGSDSDVCHKRGVCDGTVFKISTTGSETVLYNFKGGSDGRLPYANLVDVDGTLYGTTGSGGRSGCYAGCGTVFKITRSGAESVLHRFAGGSDGASPVAGLIEVNGALYGTTEAGGGSCQSSVCGAVFKITRSGAETVLHSFTGSASDGGTPLAGLIDTDGTLYGTTEQGGKNGQGAVFLMSL